MQGADLLSLLICFASGNARTLPLSQKFRKNLYFFFPVSILYLLFWVNSKTKLSTDSVGSICRHLGNTPDKMCSEFELCTKNLNMFLTVWLFSCEKCILHITNFYVFSLFCLSPGFAFIQVPPPPPLSSYITGMHPMPSINHIMRFFFSCSILIIQICITLHMPQSYYTVNDLNFLLTAILAERKRRAGYTEELQLRNVCIKSD